MKKILSAFVLMVLVWGCAKKITPANTGTEAPSSKTQTVPAEPTVGKGVEVTNSETGVLTVDKNGNVNTNVSPKETAADAAVAAGQNIYNAKCGSCHGLKATGDFTAERWTGILNVMAPKANLTDAEKENVYAYVKANAKK